MNPDPKISDAEFAQSLQVGDKWQSVLRDRYSLRVDTLLAERMTEANVWVSGNRYNRKTGSKVGGSYGDRIPRPSSAKDIAEARREIEHARLWRSIASHDWRSESLETLRSVGEILKAAKEKRDGER